MAFNFEGIGKRIAVIKGGKYDKKAVYISTPENVDAINKPFTNLELDNGKFQQSIDTNEDGQIYPRIMYITGASGSGKSFYTLQFVNEYLKKHKRNKVYLFSALDEDDTLDSDKRIKRIMIDEDIGEESIDDFENTMCIFDDVDVLPKKEKDAIYFLLNKFLQVGRHKNINVVFTSHLPSDNRNTRVILNEANTITYNPSGSSHSIKYLLKTYCGLSLGQIKKIKGLKTRMATIYRNYPQFVLTEQNLYILNDESE